MSDWHALPRLLVVDDVFGRTSAEGWNTQRADLCAQYLLLDCSSDAPPAQSQGVRAPVARAVFVRGQTPALARAGDVVENDLEGSLLAVASGIGAAVAATDRWAMVLLDLCFYTGPVMHTEEPSEAGVPHGRARDSDPTHYFGLTLLRHIRERFPELPVVVFSSMASTPVAEAVAALGAAGFLPRDVADPAGALRTTLARHGLFNDPDSPIVGHSLPLLRALRDARRASLDRRHVLLLGERGVGKELFAHFIHSHSTRPGPLEVVDGGTLSADLYGSTLFGHTRGAFTGAVASKEGAIARADGGDLFLDEVANLSPGVQAGLLRALASGEIAPIGATEPRKVDIRVISATNEPIRQLQSNTAFRADLLDRLTGGGVIEIPPLRERSEDVLLLAETFVRTAEAECPGSKARVIGDAARQAMLSYPWPGNVRELRARAYTAVRNHPDLEVLAAGHLDFSVIPLSTAGVALAGSPAPAQVAPPAAAQPIYAAPDVVAVLDFLRGVAPEHWAADDLRGALQALRGAWGACMLKLLRAALVATSRPSLKDTGREYFLQPAVRLLLGDASISSAKAADVVKQTLSLANVDEGALETGDPVRIAAERAKRLRPSSPRDSRASRTPKVEGVRQ